MDDHRSGQRRRTLKAGKIVFNRGGGIDATVKNLSETGALLEVATIIDIPDEFTLVIGTDQFKRNCRIVWRHPTKLGVVFT